MPTHPNHNVCWVKVHSGNCRFICQYTHYHYCKQQQKSPPTKNQKTDRTSTTRSAKNHKQKQTHQYQIIKILLYINLTKLDLTRPDININDVFFSWWLKLKFLLVIMTFYPQQVYLATAENNKHIQVTHNQQQSHTKVIHHPVIHEQTGTQIVTKCIWVTYSIKLLQLVI